MAWVTFNKVFAMIKHVLKWLFITSCRNTFTGCNPGHICIHFTNSRLPTFTDLFLLVHVLSIFLLFEIAIDKYLVKFNMCLICCCQRLPVICLTKYSEMKLTNFGVMRCYQTTLIFKYFCSSSYILITFLTFLNILHRISVTFFTPHLFVTIYNYLVVFSVLCFLYLIDLLYIFFNA